MAWTCDGLTDVFSYGYVCETCASSVRTQRNNTWVLAETVGNCLCCAVWLANIYGHGLAWLCIWLVYHPFGCQVHSPTGIADMCVGLLCGAILCSAPVDCVTRTLTLELAISTCCLRRLLLYALAALLHHW